MKTDTQVMISCFPSARETVIGRGMLRIGHYNPTPMTDARNPRRMDGGRPSRGRGTPTVRLAARSSAWMAFTLAMALTACGEAEELQPPGRPESGPLGVLPTAVRVDDDPSRDGWDSEAFSDAVGRQWDLVERWVAAPGDVDTATLGRLADEAFDGGALRPARTKRIRDRADRKSVV